MPRGFRVSAFAGWSDHRGRRFDGFDSRDDATAFAAGLADPLVDVIDLDHGGVVASRRLVPFTDLHGGYDRYVALFGPFVPRDDFPGGAPR